MPALVARTSSAPSPNKIKIPPDVLSSASRASPTPAGISGTRKTQSCHQYAELQAIFRDHSFEQHFQPNSTILLHGDPAEAVYLVVSGAVRCCSIGPSGNRQIFSFANKGAFIGISDVDFWHFTAEAINHVIVKAVPRSVLEQKLATNIPLRHEIRVCMRELLAKREEQLLLLSTAKGPERLYHFLEGFAASRPGKGTGDGYITLPMCRRDIGDHIGLSMESVSRAFSHLKRKGLIELKSHDKFRLTAKIPAGSLTAVPPTAN